MFYQNSRGLMIKDEILLVFIEKVIKGINHS